MLEKKSEWILPENLRKSESQQKSSATKNPESDFGSYALLRSGTKNSNIESHNAVGEYAWLFAQYLKSLVRINSMKNLKIADMGSGAGFVANEVRKVFPNATIDAFELSEDAVLFANEQFPQVNSVQKAIDENSEFNGPYDVIYCKEFYPFTRTGSIEFHKKYIDLFLKNIFDDGILVISALDTPTSIVPNLGKLKNDYKKLEVIVQPSRFAFKIAFGHFFTSQILTKILAKLRRTSLAYIILIKNSPDSKR